MSKLTETADLLLNSSADLRICLRAGDTRSARMHLEKIAGHIGLITAIIEVVEEMNQPAKQERQNRQPVKRDGALSRYIRASLSGLQPGQLRYVCPTEQFPIEKLKGSVSSICSTDWGKGKYTTQQVWSAENSSDCILVMRG